MGMPMWVAMGMMGGGVPSETQNPTPYTQQGYLAHKKGNHLGPYGRSVPRALPLGPL